jgi:DEAD/DEAH box helicase domain-containing protein
VVERRTGRVLGRVDASRADETLHVGAVYVHQGVVHVVVDRDPEAGVALVVAGDPGWTTQARTVASCSVGPPTRDVEHDGVHCRLGPVTVRSQVVSFLRRGPGGVVLGEHPLQLPERSMTTVGVCWSMAPEALTRARVGSRALPGALHATEHTLVGLLPLVAAADRRDLGAASDVTHPEVGLPTLVVFDRHPGGAGFAERGYAARDSWLRAARQTVAECGCPDGCPSCVQSPSCGRGNTALDKAGARALLGLLTDGPG